MTRLNYSHFWQENSNSSLKNSRYKQKEILGWNWDILFDFNTLWLLLERSYISECRISWPLKVKLQKWSEKWCIRVSTTDSSEDSDPEWSMSNCLTDETVQFWCWKISFRVSLLGSKEHKKTTRGLWDHVLYYTRQLRKMMNRALKFSPPLARHLQVTKHKKGCKIKVGEARKTCGELWCNDF